MLKDILNVKTILFLIVIVLAGYLSTQFPDEAVLVCGVSAIIVIAVWLFQIENENN